MLRCPYNRREEVGQGGVCGTGLMPGTCGKFLVRSRVGYNALYKIFSIEWTYENGAQFKRHLASPDTKGSCHSVSPKATVTIGPVTTLKQPHDLLKNVFYLQCWGSVA